MGLLFGRHGDDERCAPGCFFFALDAAKDRVDHAGGVGRSVGAGHLHAFMDGGVRRDAVHVQQLEDAEAQREQGCVVKFGVGALEHGAQYGVELQLPAEDAEDERGGEVAVFGGEAVDGGGVQQVVGVSGAGHDAIEDLDGGVARGRDGGLVTGFHACFRIRGLETSWWQEGSSEENYIAMCDRLWYVFPAKRFVISFVGGSSMRRVSPFAFVRCVCAVVCFAVGASAVSQTNNGPEDAKLLKFDVVSIRLSSADPKEEHISILPDGYEAIGFPIETTLLIAYASAPFFKHLEELKGVPSWVGSERYDIRAKLAPADVVPWRSLNQNIMRTAPVLQHLLQQVLAERCNLRIHGVETKVDGLALHVGAKSPALVEDSTVPVGGQGSPLLDGARFVYTKQNGEQIYTFYNTSMSVLANWLTVGSKYQVEDRTGLRGRYKFVLRRVAEQPGEGDAMTQVDAPVPWDLSAVGLRVDREKMTSTTWIVDGIERPSAN